MRIGIISDSHKRDDYTKEVLDFLISKEIAYIIHAGDFGTEENLNLLKLTNLPYIGVYGNNDAHLAKVSHKYNIKKEPYYFKIKETTFKLMHLPFYMSGDSDVVIFGHTHIFEHDFKGNSLFLNPGEICAREKPRIESVILEIKENRYNINYHFRQLDKTTWETEEYCYSTNKIE